MPIRQLTCACQMPWMFQWMFDYLEESHAFGNSSIQTSYCCVQQPFWPLKQTGRTIILISSPWILQKKSICENIFINVFRGEGRHFLREQTLYGLELRVKKVIITYRLSLAIPNDWNNWQRYLCRGKNLFEIETFGVPALLLFTFVFYAVYMAESKSSQIALKKAVFCLLSIFCIRVFSGNADINKKNNNNKINKRQNQKLEKYFMQA